MEMAIDKRRADQHVVAINFLGGQNGKLRTDVDDLAMLARDINTGAAIGKVGIFKDQIIRRFK